MWAVIIAASAAFVLVFILTGVLIYVGLWFLAHAIWGRHGYGKRGAPES